MSIAALSNVNSLEKPKNNNSEGVKGTNFTRLFAENTIKK